jgi:hypothetical protein
MAAGLAIRGWAGICRTRQRHARTCVEATILKTLLSVAIAATLFVGCGPAAQVEQGMPAGAAIFEQTDPTCLPNPDGSFRCTLARAPAGEAGTFLGYKEVLAIDGVAAGGCIGLDATGMTWQCFIGQAAVDHEIISQDFLGQPVSGPGQG